MKKQSVILKLNTISELHQHQGLPKPKHPLISVFPLSEVAKEKMAWTGSMVIGFYCIAIKKGVGKMKYGQRYFDYDSGTMSFFSPNQVLTHEVKDVVPTEGIVLQFHADFLAGYPLAKTIKGYNFFSYEVNEALHLSDQEEAKVVGMMQNIATEYQSNIDKFSQDVMIAQIDLLLKHCNRFYDRQFITRKPANNELLIRLEGFLTQYFSDEKRGSSGLPTVHQVAEHLNISSDYLSDMLKSITGQTTQQHIHNKVIDKGKELLSTTELSVQQIAYQLGFEYPQSFNKLFKNKTNSSPLEFRQSFN